MRFSLKQACETGHCCGHCFVFTPILEEMIQFTALKFHMEPEKKCLEKEIPNLETIIFRFQPLNFGGVTNLFQVGLVQPPTRSWRFQGIETSKLGPIKRV